MPADEERWDAVHRMLGKFEAFVEDARQRDDRVFRTLTDMNSKLTSLAAVPDQIAEHVDDDNRLHAGIDKRVRLIEVCQSESRGRRVAIEGSRTFLAALAGGAAAWFEAALRWHR